MVTLVALLFNLAFYVIAVSYNIRNPNEHLQSLMLIVGIDFLLLGCTFGIVSYKICSLIKINFPEFYLENRRTLIFATVGLTVPLYFRGISDTLRYFSEWYQDIVTKYELAYNIFDLLFFDLIPILFQLSSMVFGYIRKKNNKKLVLRDQSMSAENHLLSSDFEAQSESNLSVNTGSYFDPPLLSGFGSKSRQISR